MAEIVYPPVIAAALLGFRLFDTPLDVRGAQHLPRHGGAVLAINHIGYLDFIYAGAAALKVRRLVRFMAKQEVFEHPVSGPLMRGMKHIPVDRAAGSASYRLALQALRDGEFVGVFPEATISRSFTLKETKNGATRMAMRAGVPLVPVVLWGTQRLMTKGRPTKLRRHVPVVVCIGEPIPYERGDSPDVVHGRLVTAMQRMLDEVQRSYPDSPADDGDRWWLPAHLGGSAPTPEEAAVLDATETASRG